MNTLFILKSVFEADYGCQDRKTDFDRNKYIAAVLMDLSKQGI